MKKLFVTLALLLLANLRAQELPNVIPPSPEARAFEKYGNIPVSTYTGVPNIIIPLYTIKQGDITVPISLSYHASGVKVDEEASTVGLGWVLNAGGIISRNIYGDDDFTNNYYFNIGGEGRAYLDDSVDDIIMDNQASNYTIDGSSVAGPAADANCSVYVNGIDLKNELGFSSGYGFQPDHFSFNFFGNNGKFILNRSGEAIFAKQQKIDIQHFVNTPQDNEFIATLSNGMIYKFAEGAKTLQSTTDNQSGGTSSWLLEKITSPTTGSMVNFKYSDYNTNSLIKGNHRASQTNYIRSVPNPKLAIIGSYPSCPATGITDNVVSSVYEEKYLEYIDFKNGRVVFEYVPGRLDLENSKFLKSFKVYIKDASGRITSSPIKEILFTYEYFNSIEGYETVKDIPGNIFSSYTAIQKGYINKRLKLKKVQEVGKPEYIFTYYNEYDNSIFRGKGTYSKDHWGFLNAGSSSLIPAFKGILPFSNNVDIHEIRGGNRKPDPTKISIFSLKDIIYPTSGKTEFIYESNTYDYNASIKNNDATYRDLNIINDPTEKPGRHSHLHIPGILMDEGSLQGQIFESTFTIPNGNGRTYVEFRVDLQSATDDIPTNIPDTAVYLETPDNVIYYPQLCASGANEGPSGCSITGSYFLNPGTYSIKSTITTDEIYSLYANFNWTENSSSTAITYGGGQRIREIRNYDGTNKLPSNIKTYDYHYKASGELRTHGLLMAKPLYALNKYSPSYSCSSFLLTSDSQVNLSNTPVAYSQVSVYNGENGEYGKSTFYYRNEPDIIIRYDGYRKKYPAITFNSNGLLEKQIDYKFKKEENKYYKIKEVKNVYSKERTSIQPESSLYMGISKNYVFADSRGGGTQSNSSEYEACFSYYYLYPSLMTNFIKLENSTETIFKLGSTTEGIATSVDYEYSDSHKQLTKTTTTNSKGEILVSESKYAEDLNQTNLISKHIHNVPLWQEQRFNDGTILSTTETIYPQTGLPLPVSIQSSKDNQDLEDRINFHKYDNNGNLLEVSKEDGVSIVYVWGYKSEYPIAKIENATFQENKTNTISNNQQSLIDAAVLAADNDTTDATENTLNNKLKLLQEGFSNAMVTTYTYDPLIGVTSMTDPRGYTIFYNYDDFNRLESVKDVEGNLVTDYEYGYRQVVE
ncbi:RHS repeat protein [Zobellia laminariae]|uniref:RHS repeat protein n=1 Tax=Zobellia laminariae TaxID=248906 RepID=UPI0012D8F8D6|nr:hypothetical protein [Zobellia laminariae]